MRAALAAEWTKLRSTPGPAWLLLAAAAGTVGLDAVSRHAVRGVYLGQVPVAVLGVLAVSGEYSTGLIRTTLAAIPRRSTVLAAKVLVLAGVVGAVAGVAMLFARTSAPVVYLVLIALLSVGVAAAVRDSAAATGVVLGVLYLPPIITATVAEPHWHRLLERVAPMSGGLCVLAAWSAAALVVGAFLFRSRDT